MFGYMTALNNELRVRELNLYRAYYCGICKSIARRFGHFPRMLLSYDAVLLAIILSSLDEEVEAVSMQHCLVHHIKKNPVVENSKAVDYAADMMLISAYYKTCDDVDDEKSIKARAGKLLLRGTFSKLRIRYHKLCLLIEDYLKNLSKLEKDKSPSLDETSKASAAVMAEILSGYSEDYSFNLILRELGQNLGAWLYVIDALDDFDEDKKKGLYNPLIYRHNGREGLEPLLYNYLANATAAFDLLDIKKNDSLIRNILFLGLRAKTESILADKLRKDEEVVNE